MNALTAPYRPGAVGVIAVGSVLLGLGASVTYWAGTAGAFDLRDLINTARPSLAVLAFPLGWLGVWAARVHSANSVTVGVAPGRSRQQIVLRQAAVLASATSVGWLAGWAVPMALALAGQYWTPVDVLAMVTLAVAVGSITSIGLAVSMLADVRVGSFLTPAVLLIVMLVPSYGINAHLLSGLPLSTQALSYVWTISGPARGEQLVWGTELVRLGFYLLVWFSSAQAAGGWAEFRATHRRDALATTSWLAFPLVVSVVVAFVMPLLYVTDPNDQVTCGNRTGYTLCLYQIDEPHRADFEAFLAPLTPLLPSTDVAKLTITQDDGVQGDTISISRLGQGRLDWTGSQLNSVVRNLFQPWPDPQARCDGKPDETLSVTSELEESIIRQVGRRAAAAAHDDTQLSEQYTRIANPGGSDLTLAAADRWLDLLDDHQFRDWYHQNRPLLTRCALTGQAFR